MLSARLTEVRTELQAAIESDNTEVLQGVDINCLHSIEKTLNKLLRIDSRKTTAESRQFADYRRLCADFLLLADGVDIKSLGFGKHVPNENEQVLTSAELSAKKLQIESKEAANA